MVDPVVKRGRKRVYDSEKTRGIILDAASAIFAESGFRGSSVDTIAERSGYNKSLIFQYFGNKQGLYAQVIRRADQEMIELLRRQFAPLSEDESILEDASKFRAFLKTTFAAFFDYMVEHPEFMRIMNWEQAEGWQTFIRLASQFEPEDLARFEAVFEIARRAGLLRPGFESVTGVVLIEQLCWSVPAALPLYRLLLAARDVPPAAVPALVRDQVVDFLIAGIMGAFEGQ